MGESVRVFSAGERSQRPTTQTEGMRREELIANADGWVGMVRTPAGSTSGWHHHGEYNTYVYGISGKIRFEYGAGGNDTVEGGTGDVFHIPRGLIHREGNPGPEEGMVFLVRVGRGEPVINVEGPAE